ncbi:MAG TPA: hypothetical protein V6C57_04075 [Coleofasciculaceae cyanobacterium]
MMPFIVILTLAQVQQTPPSDPLIAHSGEDAIYIGLGFLAVILVLIVGLFSRRLELAVIFALILSIIIAILIIVT